LIGVAVFGAATLKPAPGPAITTASPIAMATAPAAARRRGNTEFMGIPSWFPDAEVEETRLGRPFGQQEMNDGRRSTEIRALFRP
jgi:hypothetical protein